LKGNESRYDYEQWDSLTSKFSGAANVPFLLLQMPQILLNARNLIAGNNTALFAIPWLVISFLFFFMYSRFYHQFSNHRVVGLRMIL